MEVLKHYSQTLKTSNILVLLILNVMLTARDNFLCSQASLKPSRHMDHYKLCRANAKLDTASSEVQDFFLFNTLEV